MKLQLAYDGIHLDDAVRCIEQIQEYVDIIEIGTPFVLSVGMEGVRTMRRLFPEKEILADMKIMDGGKKEAEMAFESGADYVTMLGVTDRATIAACVKAAKQYEKKTVVDMICVPDFRKTVADVEALGVDYIAVHTLSLIHIWHGCVLPARFLPRLQSAAYSESAVHEECAGHPPAFFQKHSPHSE